MHACEGRACGLLNLFGSCRRPRTVSLRLNPEEVVVWVLEAELPHKQKLLVLYAEGSFHKVLSQVQAPFKISQQQSWARPPLLLSCCQSGKTILSWVGGAGLVATESSLSFCLAHQEKFPPATSSLKLSTVTLSPTQPTSFLLSHVQERCPYGPVIFAPLKQMLTIFLETTSAFWSVSPINLPSNHFSPEACQPSTNCLITLTGTGSPGLKNLTFPWLVHAMFLLFVGPGGTLLGTQWRAKQSFVCWNCKFGVVLSCSPGWWQEQQPERGMLF